MATMSAGKLFDKLIDLINNKGISEQELDKKLIHLNKALYYYKRSKQAPIPTSPLRIQGVTPSYPGDVNDSADQ